MKKTILLLMLGATAVATSVRWAMRAFQLPAAATWSQ
ncbi:hypothetical protein SPHI_00690 [Sphingomonas jeddahensis]|uniref:Uncharacterized protein n=1 Tax=Sphingomonas jeddahensis TaxID=1915074 RepID=A0A1V2EZ35_9SPHN|nr:hypothetical protein SPHI_00690 [Sphingomonas jeddahensis]